MRVPLVVRFIFCWGFLPVQGDWSLSRDHGLDYGDDELTLLGLDLYLL